MRFVRFLAHTLLTHKALALLPSMFTSIGSFDHRLTPVLLRSPDTR